MPPLWRIDKARRRGYRREKGTAAAEMPLLFICRMGYSRIEPLTGGATRLAMPNIGCGRN